MHGDLDTHDAGAPIFAPEAFGIADAHAELIAQARRFGARVLAPRATQHDRDATFPIENFRDMDGAGLLGICIPKEDGGLGADFRTYSLAAAALGRSVGPAARAAHLNGPRLHYRRILDDGAIYSQPFSEGGAAAGGGVAFGTEARPAAGGFVVTGKKIFASLSGAADYYGVLCTERGEGEAASRRNTLYLAIPANAPGVEVVGD